MIEVTDSTGKVHIVPKIPLNAKDSLLVEKALAAKAK
jgi:hypothetical protein